MILRGGRPVTARAWTGPSRHAWLARLACLAWPAGAAGVAGCGGDGPASREEVGTSASADTTQCSAGPYVDGIDIYDGTGTVDWPKVKAGGIGFAIIKATQGNYNTQ